MASFLERYKRQPKLYIDLPTGGQWYPPGALLDDQSHHMPVLGMTAMDEIVLKTPDALFNGEATAQVIASCVPHILDPWQIPTFDLDYLLIAMRVATYGENLNVATKCPNCGEKTESSVSLQKLLDTFNNKPTTNSFEHEDLTVHLKPITYKQFSDFNLREYALQRQLVNITKQVETTPEDQDKQVRTLLDDLAKLNLELAVAHIFSLEAGEEKESNPAEIYQFIAQTDAVFFQKLKDAVKKLKDDWDIPAMEVQCAATECEKTYKTGLNLDYSSFFAVRR